MDPYLLAKMARAILRSALAVPYREFGTALMTTWVAIAMTHEQFETLRRFAESDQEDPHAG